MSLALLKTVLFPAERRLSTPKPIPSIHGPAGSASQSDPAPALLNRSHKDSEVSWLSCESSVDLDHRYKRSGSFAPPPLAEKDLAGVPSTNSSTEADLEAQKPPGSDPPPEQPPAKRWGFKVSPRMISDAIIGVSDGMTVPFALTAGLASIGDTKLVVLGGLAELIAGALSMGLGGFIGAKSEAESYRATVTSTQKQIRQFSPLQTSALIHAVFTPYNLPPATTTAIATALHDSPAALLDFLVRFHHQHAEPDAARPFVCALTISLGYFLGGLVPLIPYFCVHRHQVYTALWWSIGVMAAALFAFGWVKTGVVVGWRGKGNVVAGLRGALQMVMIGGTAAGAAVGLVRAINH